MPIVPKKRFLRPRNVLAFAALVLGYVVYAEASAHWKAAAFCRDTAVGSSVDRLPERAAADRAVDLNNSATWGDSVKPLIRWTHSPNGVVAWLPVTFLGFGSHIKHICVITAVDGKVEYGEHQHLD
jgi:hypothetical protein